MLKIIKQFRNKVDRWINNLDKNWRRLPLKKQRAYTVYLFLGYLIATLLIILQICLSGPTANHQYHIEHIKNLTPANEERSLPAQTQLKTNHQKTERHERNRK